MILEALINKQFPNLQFSDTESKAVKLMKTFNCSFIPVVNNKILMGFVKKSNLNPESNSQKIISDCLLAGKKCVVVAETHFFDIISIALEHKMNIVGVVDDKNEYVGVVTLENIMRLYSHVDSINIPRSVLILSMRYIDYSLAQICRYIEEESAKVLTSYLIADELSPNEVKLILIINRKDLFRIISTFERNNYNIVGIYQESLFEDTNKASISYLLKYIDI